MFRSCRSVNRLETDFEMVFGLQDADDRWVCRCFYAAHCVYFVLFESGSANVVMCGVLDGEEFRKKRYCETGV